MKIGILGSGSVAQTLAAGLMDCGHELMLGTRDPVRLQTWLAAHPKAVAGTLADAARFGDVLILAVTGTAALDALHLVGAAATAGKVVIDATNPIAPVPPQRGVLSYYTRLDDSQMERLQREFPESYFVKAFNSVSTAVMVRPAFEAGRPTMFICGNDDAAKQVVSGLLDQLGWAAEDMGGVEAARAIEPLCMLMVIPGMLRNEWRLALRVLRC